ncbi:MAG: hypothetical protein ACJA1R_002917, partial [Flavobacteriales bacterium]
MSVMKSTAHAGNRHITLNRSTYSPVC